jgi:hypothetical protein
MSIHNKIMAIFGKVKNLPNYTQYKNTIIFTPAHIQIITQKRIYYIRNTLQNIQRLNFPVFYSFTRIDKTNKVQKEVK